VLPTRTWTCSHPETRLPTLRGDGVGLPDERSRWNRTVVTDGDGRFHFPEVPEGSHRVALALRELPADFDPGPIQETTVAVYPSKLARGELDVIRLAFIQGKVTGPPDVPVDTIVIRMAPGGRYTTPDGEGTFTFYNLREGDYSLALDEKSLPEYGVTDKPDGVSVSVRLGQQPQAVNFQFDVHKPTKPVRKVLLKATGEQPRPREPEPPGGIGPCSVPTLAGCAAPAGQPADNPAGHPAGQR